MKEQRCFSLCMAFVLLAATGPLGAQQTPPVSSIYHDGWIDLNKNGTTDPYESPKLGVEERITDLLSQMTLEEKTCQLATLYGFGRVLRDEVPTPAWKTAIWKDGIANIDEQLNGVRGDSDYFWPPSRHAEAFNRIQRFFIEETRLGIPADMTNEGIRGLCAVKSTSFPAQSALGCTFDVELISAIGHVTGKEARALGYTSVYSPILDLARDPRWGRVVECYTEDPYLGSRLGVAQIKGVQAEGVASSPKHFAVYSIPKGGRDGSARTDPHASWREVQTVLLAPFRAGVVEGHMMGTMASYNDYDGIPVAGSELFLTRLLRQEWGFKGYVVSDSDSVAFINGKHKVAPDYKDAARQALLAGLNVRTTFNAPDVFINPVRELVREGTLPMSIIDARVRDVLRNKFVLGEFDHPYIETPAASDAIVNCETHRNLALRACHESVVLLKNRNQTLPLKKDLKSILVCGPNATIKESNNRYGPQKISPISPLEGIQAAAGRDCQVVYVKGCDIRDANFPDSDVMRFPVSAQAKADIDKAVAAAANVDAIIAVMGENDSLVGEGKSRASLDLPGNQNDLLLALAATGKPLVVVLINGRALSVNWADRTAGAIVEAWFLGEFTGPALADVLFGDYNPGGKLAFTFPKGVGQVELNFPAMPASQAGGNAEVVGPLYPFGYGLSYTTFEYSNLQIEPLSAATEGLVRISADVANTGMRAGDEVVQLYFRDLLATVITPERQLRGFQRVALKPGEKKTVSFTLGMEDLSLFDRQGNWTVEPGDFQVWVGGSSVDTPLTGVFEVIKSGDRLQARPSERSSSANRGSRQRDRVAPAAGTRLEGDPEDPSREIR